ncbi:nascent polypeptide-associated complex subunit alpha, muscle-specific form [Fukomys damarensis]|uniref:nascent polypeptide-associated complex subunit alpha, muscle-specific form n=1 Tax=Fukomys damarensis TaxID=885580 RepID=UPI001455920A|nr:nascent polypeptide-associated complex subunit alpha, muscle-specific form [Fukomys damarensis]
MDAQALRKRLSRTSGEAARTLLSSLLLYVLDRAEGPPQAENGEHRASCSALPQEASRRPTRFQLLQAKFMGRGREPPLKRTREVGRLISKDRQGPSRSFVNATINKLLEKAGEASGPSQRPAAPEKPRWGGTGGKSTVKNILKKFLAAEEREAKEKEVHERPTGLRPGATRGPLSKVAGRSTILAKLRERFEQSGCLHAEVKVLPLHKEDRRSRALQRRMHRPEVRVLHMAAMAISCTRTPPARFLACTAEPLPSLSIATVVGSPHSWLSRCAKISHLDARRQARTEASLYPSLGHTEPGGNETPGVGILSGDPRGQWKPSESSVPQAMALWDPHPALTIAGALQPEFPCASSKDRALPGHLPAVALLSPASPRDARPAGGDRMVEPTAAGAADHIPGVEEGAEEAPRVTMTVCSSEDEAESTVPASEREPLFATQRRWLPKPQQEAEPHVTPAIPAVQAVQSTQPGIESPQITVQLPVVLKMPQRSTLSPEAWCPQVSQGEAVMGRGAPGPVAGDRRDTPAPERLSRPGQVPERPLSSEPGPQRALRDAAGMEHNTPQPVLTPKSPSSTGKGNCCSHPEPSGPTTSVYSSETHTLPVSNETKMLSKAPSSHHPPVWKSCPLGSSHAPPGPAPAYVPGLGPQETDSLLAASQDCRQPESSTSMDQSIPCGQEKSSGLLTEPLLPLGVVPENPSHDLGKNRPSWLGDQPETGISPSRETTAAGKVTDPTAPLAGPQKTPQVDTQTAPLLLGAHTAPQLPGTQTAPQLLDAQIAPRAATQTAPQADSQTAPQLLGTQTDPQLLGAQTLPQADTQTAPQLLGTQTATQADAQAVPQLPGTHTAPQADEQAAPQLPGTHTATQADTQAAPELPGTHTAPQADAQTAPQLPGTHTAPQADAQTAPQLPGTHIAPQADAQTAPQLLGTQTLPQADVQTAPQLPGTQTAPQFLGAQTLPQADAQTAPQLLGAQTLPQADAQTAPQLPGTQIAPQLLGAQTAPQADAQTAPQLLGTQIAPRADAQVLENETAELAALDEEAGRTLSACPCATAEEGLPHEPAPNGPSMRRIGTTEGDILGWAQHQALTMHPGDAAKPSLSPVVSRLCAPSYLKASGPSASAENIRPVGVDALCNSMTPQSSQGCGLGRPRWPSPEPQAQGRRGFQPNPQPPPPGKVCPSAHPTDQTHVVEAPPTRQAPELPAPGQQAEPRAVPKVKSSGPAPAGMGPPEGHCGPVCSQQTGRQDSPQKMARVGPEVGEFEPETWAALDLAESKASKKPATRGKPGTSRALDQEHMQGPSVRWVGSPAQRDGTQAAGSPAAQDQGWARGTVSQARDQPGRVAKEAPTAGASRDPSTPAPSIGSQGSPSTRRPTQGDKSTSDCHPQPADGSALPAPDVGSHQVPKVLAQAGSPVTPGAEREQSECEQRRRLVQLAKYKAQSFSDQRAFDLSFRPMVLQASHTFEAPK